MSWSPDPAAFLADLEAKPAALRGLAAALEADDPWTWVPTEPPPGRVVFVGMGSSRFAALAAAARLRHAGVDAVAEYASAAAVHPGGPGTLAVGISASGGSAETIEALGRHAVAGSAAVAVTNDPTSAIAHAAGHTAQMHAGEEIGGVACRTYQHTLGLLLALESRLTGSLDVPGVLRRAAEATGDLLERRDGWLPGVTDLLTATGRAFLLAPNERLASAEQGALMLREGPRLQADACESGDWLHVDVYLTRPLDYRALLFSGSRFDPQVMEWAGAREATVVAVGAETDGARMRIRYQGDDDPLVALLTETVVPELVAARVWAAQ